MSKILKKDLLLGAYYSNNFKCAQIDEIFNYISDDGSLVCDKLNNIQKNFVKSEINEYKKSFENNVSSKVKNLTEKDFYQIFDKMIDLFHKEFNIKNYKKPNIQIVDNFPHPFEDRNYKAMTFNKTHEKTFNVPEGIYLLKKYMVHGITEIMIAHEIMHYVESYFTPQAEQLKQCPFLVEGAVDFMSVYLLLKYKIVDDVCIRNWILFGRGNCSKEFIGSLYFKQAKQMMFLAKKHGIKYLKKIIIKGDRFISQIDLSDSVHLGYKKITDKILKKVVSFYDLVLTSIVITVDEKFLFDYTLGLTDGKDIEKITIKGYDKEKIKEILLSLQKGGFVYILDNKVFNTNFKEFATLKISIT